MLQEFKKFALRGNVLDLAIGVIIGAAFGRIVTSLVDDVMMPPISVLLSVSHVANFEDRCPAVECSQRTGIQKGDLARICQAREYRHDQLRTLRQQHPQLPDRFLLGLFDRQAGQSRVAAAAEDPRVPACCAAISIKARRCPNCTSEVTPLVD